MLLKTKRTTASAVQLETYRQGDVLVQKIDKMPELANPVKCEGRVILQHGEVTGHCHAISTEVARMYTAKGQRYLEILEGGARLVHEEHGTIILPQGYYRVIQQREYVPEAPPRDVVD